MNVRQEIKKHSKDSDIPILLWLFERYHMDWQWRFVATCRFERYGKMSYETNRVWSPTTEGVILYAGMREEITAAKFEEATGHLPVQDDLERSNCPDAGTLGHECCGWNHKQNVPQFMAKPED